MVLGLGFEVLSLQGLGLRGFNVWRFQGMSQGDARFGRLEDMEIHGDASCFCALQASPNPKPHAPSTLSPKPLGLGGEGLGG